MNRAWGSFSDTEIRSYRNTLNSPLGCPVFPSWNIQCSISPTKFCTKLSGYNTNENVYLFFQVQFKRL